MGEITLEWTTIYVLAVVFVATLVRSALGFGEALVAVPLLALLMPEKVATPLATLLSITVAAVILLQDWRSVHVHSAWKLVFSTLFGIPLGVAMLVFMDDQIVKMVLGCLIMAFSLFCLFNKMKHELKNDNLAWIFGFAAGVMGGAYAMNGPPLVVYSSLRRWTRQHFRATLQGYFLPASLVGMLGYWLGGLWVPQVTEYFFLSLPVAVAAIFLGRWLNHRMKEGAFVLYVYVGLCGTGCVLVVKSIYN